MVRPKSEWSKSLTTGLCLGIMLSCVGGSRNEKRSLGAGVACGFVSATNPKTLP